MHPCTIAACVVGGGEWHIFLQNWSCRQIARWRDSDKGMENKNVGGNNGSSDWLFFHPMGNDNDWNWADRDHSNNTWLNLITFSFMNDEKYVE